MTTAIEEMGGQIAHAREEIKNLFAKKDEKTKQLSWNTDDEASYHALVKKVDDLQPRYNRAVELDAAERKNADDLAELRKPRRVGAFSAGGDGATASGAGGVAGLANDPDPYKGLSAAGWLAKAVVTSDRYTKDFSSHNPVKVKIENFDSTDLIAERKTVMTTTAGFPPFSVRGNVRVPSALRRPVVGDLITQNMTNQTSILYMEETTFTNNAAAVAEGAVKPESANAWTQRSSPVEVIATVLPVTEQQLEDVDGIEAVIRDRLTLMIMLAEENYILNGTGTSPQIQGLLTKTGVQTYVQGADDAGEEIADALLRAMTKVRSIGFSEPSGIILHPTDSQTVRLLKTTEGLYIFGSPSEAGPGTIWGMEPVVTTAMTAGTALVGGFNNPMYVHISRKKGITIDVGYINDDFSRNQRTIRAETRLSQEVGRPAAFVKVMGLS